jgi:hypothetical protein
VTDGVDMNVEIIDRRAKKNKTQTSKTENKEDYSRVVLINGLLLLVHDKIRVWGLFL